MQKVIKLWPHFPEKSFGAINISEIPQFAEKPRWRLWSSCTK